jgi:hypothetical protein
MVFLAITRSGLNEAMALAESNHTPVWCGSDAISEHDYANLKTHNVSRFNYPLGNSNADTLAGALETISDHHPNERIWIENAIEP